MGNAYFFSSYLSKSTAGLYVSGVVRPLKASGLKGPYSDKSFNALMSLSKMILWLFAVTTSLTIS